MVIDVSPACTGVVWCVSSSSQKQRQQAAHSALVSPRHTATLRPFALDSLCQLFMRTTGSFATLTATDFHWKLRLHSAGMHLARATPSRLIEYDRTWAGMVHLALRTADSWRTPFESSFARKSERWLVC